MLTLFCNIEKNYEKIINQYTRDNGFDPFMNYILCENKNNLIDKFIFFIAGFLKVIDIAGKNGYFIIKA